MVKENQLHRAPTFNINSYSKHLQHRKVINYMYATYILPAWSREYLSRGHLQDRRVGEEDIAVGLDLKADCHWQVPSILDGHSATGWLAQTTKEGNKLQQGTTIAWPCEHTMRAHKSILHHLHIHMYMYVCVCVMYKVQSGQSMDCPVQTSNLSLRNNPRSGCTSLGLYTQQSAQSTD